MRKFLPVLITIIVGLLTLVGILFYEFFTPFLSILLQWGILLATVMTIVGILNLLSTHVVRVTKGRKGFFFSLIVVISFLVSFIGGLLLGPEHPGYLKWVASIRVPLEVSLLGLLALTLTYAGIQFFRTKGWTAVSVSFGISALVFLVLGLGLVQSIGNPIVDQVVLFIERLPIAGGRGILIGISLGALLVGLRSLFGFEQPGGDR